MCGALLISGAIGLYFSYQENKAALASLQREKAVAAAARIEQFVRQIEQQLAFAALPQLGAEGIEQRRIEFLKLLRLVPAVTDIAQIDGRGREQLAVSRLAMDVAGGGRDRSQEPAFANARPGQTWFGPVYFRKETEPYMSIAVRSGGAGGPVTVAEVNLKFIWDVVTRIKIGQKGKAYVVDGTGHLVADPDIGLVLRKTNLSGLEQVRTALEPGADDNQAMLARDPAGGAVLTAYAPIDPLGWRVFVEQPVSEVFAALDATIVRTVLLIVAGLAFSGLAAAWLARSMARPIGVLQEGAARIGAGGLGERIDIRTGDELEALAAQFNRMSGQLRESYAGLERKVEERTAELQQALEQQTATSQILQVTSSSPTDVKPVFDTILENAIRLCEGSTAVLWTYEGRRLHIAAHQNMTAGAVEHLARSPLEPGSWNPTPQAAFERRTVHVLDVFAEPGYRPLVPTGTTNTRPNAGTVLAVPLLRDNELLGVITVWRYEKRLFSQKQLDMVNTFAAQAVIAIENVRLFNETREALERQTATAEILKVISSSPTDTQPVFEAIVQSGLKLFPNAAVVVTLPDRDQVRLAAVANIDPGQADQWGKRFPFPLTREYMHGVAILDRRIVDVPDAAANTDESLAAGIENFLASGYRAITIMPMVRGRSAIGTVGVVRRAPGPLSDKQIALLRTFADQAVIAIENVRLFNETKEALEQQTATAEVLKTISRSTFDLDSVLHTLMLNATRMCNAVKGVMFLPDAEGRFVPAVAHGYEPDSPMLAELRARPIRPGRGSASGRALLERRVVHLPDVLADPEYDRRELAQLGSLRTLLAVPMLLRGEPIGVISMSRGREVEPFNDKQLELVTTFADQAVIAIENVRLFKEIEDKSRQLEIANKHKSEFLANMSHELRTPLNAIIGFSEVLMERMFGEVNEKQADYLKDIHESGRHLLSLINDILDLSKIEAGRMELELSSFHLPTALSNAMTLVRERAQRHGIQLGLEVDPLLGELQADERKLKQIVLTLLSNAVKFTPDGGRVDVSARQMEEKIQIAVRDTGIGIAPEDHAAVFEEFKQVGRDYTRKAEGTGLGLALTRRFVELHGGEIRLESAPGKGSTFTVTLPLRQ